MKTSPRINRESREPASLCGSPSLSPATVVTPCTPNSCAPEAIAPPWKWHHRTLTHLRDRLVSAHAEHTRAAIAPPETAVDAVELAQEQIEREALWSALGAEDDRLFEIDCALQRIRDGTYGFCEDTGHPIPAERLRTIPWTRYCRGAAEKRESIHRPAATAALRARQG